MTRHRYGRHDWLGLTPEVERHAPEMVARIAAALGEYPVPNLEGCIIGALIRSGDSASWMAYLANLVWLVERARAVDAAPEATRILAEVLRDQYRLAPGVLELDAGDEARWTRLEELTRCATPHCEPS